MKVRLAFPELVGCFYACDPRLFKNKSKWDPLSRQVDEMVRMTNFGGTLLNSKSEWNAPPIIRIIAENENERNFRRLDKNASEFISSVQPTPLNTKVWRGLHRAESSPKLPNQTAKP